METSHIVALVGVIVFAVGLLINLGVIAATPFAGLKVGGFAAGSVIMTIGALMVIVLGVLSRTGVVELYQNPEEQSEEEQQQQDMA